MALLFLVSRWACFFLPPQLLVFSLHSPQGAAPWANNMLLPDSYLKMSYPMLFCLQNMIFFFYLFLQEVKNLMTNNSNTSWSTRAQANWMQIFLMLLICFLYGQCLGQCVPISNSILHSTDKLRVEGKAFAWPITTATKRKSDQQKPREVKCFHPRSKLHSESLNNRLSYAFIFIQT